MNFFVNPYTFVTAGGGGDSHTFPVDGQTYEFSRTGEFVAVASFSLRNDGDFYGTMDAAPSDVADWISPKDSFSDYEVMVIQSSGDTMGGDATSTWLNLGTTRTFTLTGDADSNSAAGTASIRNAATTTVVATFSWTMEATTE